MPHRLHLGIGTEQQEITETNILKAKSAFIETQPSDDGISLKLPTKIQAKLLIAMTTEIGKIRLQPEGFINVSDVFDMSKACMAVLAEAPKTILTAISNYIGDHPIFVFLYQELRDATQGLGESDAPRALVDLENFKDSKAAAARLLGSLQALPRRYLCSVALPQPVAEAYRARGGKAIVGPTASLIGTWHESQTGFPIRGPEEVNGGNGLISSMMSVSSLRLMGPLAPAEVKTEHRLFLYVRINGFLEPYGSTRPMTKFESAYRAFIGLGIGVGVFSSFGLKGDSKPHAQAFHCGIDSIDPLGPERSDQRAEKLWSQIKIQDQDAQEIEPAIRTLLSVLNAGPESNHLRLAGRWMFDSLANEDRVMAFMQLVTVAEVLLDGGGGKEPSMTRLLANRCAYLIAETAAERETLISEFETIYGVRSAIVHRGLEWLNEEHFLQYAKLRNICARIIQAEIRMSVSEPALRRTLALAAALRQSKPDVQQ
jgi:hypothetical protein